MKLNSKSISYSAPRQGATAYENSYYSRRTGLEKIRFRILDISDDIFDCLERSFSSDNGATWGESLPPRMAETTPKGTLRHFEDNTFVDPLNGLLLNTYGEAFFQGELASEGFHSYYLKYRVSADGGRTSLVDESVVGRGFTPEHPFESVWIGVNAFNNAAQNSIVRTPQGHLVLATNTTVLDGNGGLYNPVGAYGYFEVAVLIGYWSDNGRIEWEMSARLPLPPDKSTRGSMEPALTQLPDGRLLMLMRGSNGGGGEVERAIPSYKWQSISRDAGFTWSEPLPWRYTDGTLFFSPSSIQQLMWHTNGKLYWFGNIRETHCIGNGPRYPLYAGEVDTASGLLIKDSLFVVDDRQPGQPDVQLSNFSAHEDRVTGEIVLHMSHYTEQAKDVWGGDAYIYRIQT